MKYDLMSNAELKVLQKEMENEYEALKVKIRECMDRMQTLDKRYGQVVSILHDRTKGKI